MKAPTTFCGNEEHRITKEFIELRMDVFSDSDEVVSGLRERHSDSYYPMEAATHIEGQDALINEMKKYIDYLESPKKKCEDN